MKRKRFCYYVSESLVNEKGEYTPVIVKENESGYYLTDWTWGKNFKIAQEAADHKNKLLNLTEDDVNKIVLSSMRKVH